MRFTLDRKEKIPIKIGDKTFKIPKGVLKFKKTDSSEVNEADEISRFDNKIHIYETNTKGSSNFSSDKEIPELEKQRIFDKLFEHSL